jgi:hypothetical protein
MGNTSPDARVVKAQVAVGSIVVRCVRFDELLAFWQAALGYVPREEPSDGWAVLTDPTGAGPNISLDRVAAESLPVLGELSRLHLDLYTTDPVRPRVRAGARLRRPRRSGRQPLLRRRQVGAGPSSR